MSTADEFVIFACDQMRAAGEISYRKMFGGYGIYCDGKFIGIVTDDQLYIKITSAGRKVVPDIQEVPPYPGAKPYFLIDFLEDRELLTAFLEASYPEIPMQKPRKKKM